MIKYIFGFLLFFIIFSCNKKKLNQCDETILITKTEKKFIEKYGENIKKYKPFLLKYKNDTIILIRGSMGENEIGGYPYAYIDLRTCDFIKISHGK